MLSGFSHWLLFSLTLVVSCHADEVWFCWSYSMVQKSVLECLGFFFSTEAWPSEWSFIAANDGTDVRYVEGPLRSAFYDVSVRRPAQTPTANITVRRCIAHLRSSPAAATSMFPRTRSKGWKVIICFSNNNKKSINFNANVTISGFNCYSFTFSWWYFYVSFLCIQLIFLRTAPLSK